MKKLTGLLFALLLLSPTMNVYAQEDTDRVVDNDNLISESVEQELEVRLNEVAELYELDVVILTQYSIDGYDPMTYTSNYYEEHDLGMGTNDDGLILLLSLENKDWNINTVGFGDEAYNDYAIDQFENNILSFFSEGYYDEGFTRFVTMIEDYSKEATEGVPYSYDHSYRDWTYYAIGIGIVVVAAIVIASIYLMSLIKKMDNIEKQARAQNYVDENSFELIEKSDKFLYSHTTSVRIQRNNSSGGGGGFSSGGRSGKF